MSEDQRFVTQRMDRYGIFAGMCHEIGLFLLIYALAESKSGHTLAGLSDLLMLPGRPMMLRNVGIKVVLLIVGICA